MLTRVRKFFSRKHPKGGRPRKLETYKPGTEVTFNLYGKRVRAYISSSPRVFGGQRMAEVRILESGNRLGAITTVSLDSSDTKLRRVRNAINSSK